MGANNLKLYHAKFEDSMGLVEDFVVAESLEEARDIFTKST